MVHYDATYPPLNDMGAQVSMQTVGIMSVWLETLLYGMYASLFFQTIFIILKKNKTTSGPSRVFFGGIIFMFLTATAHIGVNLHRVLNAYVYEVDTIGPVAYFGDLGRWDNLLQNFLNAGTTWVGDGLIIYRCYIVWQNNIYIVIFPISMVIVSIVANAIVGYRYARLEQVTVFSPYLVHWQNTIYALAFIQNIFTTGLIAYRIYAQDKRSNGLVATSQVSLGYLVRVMVESAAVYVLDILLLIILYAVGSNGQFIAQEAVVPVCGIVFTLMTVRLAMATDHDIRPAKTDHTTIKFGTRTNGANPGSTSTEQSGSILTQATPVKPMRTIHAGESQDDVWEGEGKYGMPLEEMFTGQGHGLVEKRGSGGSVGRSEESHNV
ncbi:hypothetical protein FIBSPDRAFT_975886 [Athelia psychrophila]|uniref:RTA1-domain-containing protein n=1 Tax=Athelia psychrophila TaxID=1759441 RepID=A0A166F5V7_9AGAM|nr:hypothetical protein FIBSPDRAFT_975886 [Fibularhizoctonia sp. CBS 109695]